MRLEKEEEGGRESPFPRLFVYLHTYIYIYIYIFIHEHVQSLSLSLPSPPPSLSPTYLHSFEPKRALIDMN